MALLPARRGSTVARPGSQAADLIRTRDAYVAEVELPGVRKDDISVELAGQELVIGGECRQSAAASPRKARPTTANRFKVAGSQPWKNRT